MAAKKVEWEFFMDESYYGKWAVRPKDDKDFDSPRLFHVDNRPKAIGLCTLLNDADCAVPVEEPKRGKK